MGRREGETEVTIEKLQAPAHMKIQNGAQIAKKQATGPIIKRKKYQQTQRILKHIATYGGYLMKLGKIS